MSRITEWAEKTKEDAAIETTVVGDSTVSVGSIVLIIIALLTIGSIFVFGSVEVNEDPIASPQNTVSQDTDTTSVTSDTTEVDGPEPTVTTISLDGQVTTTTSLDTTTTSLNDQVTTTILNQEQIIDKIIESTEGLQEAPEGVLDQAKAQISDLINKFKEGYEKGKNGEGVNLNIPDITVPGAELIQNDREEDPSDYPNGCVPPGGKRSLLSRCSESLYKEGSEVIGGDRLSRVSASSISFENPDFIDIDIEIVDEVIIVTDKPTGDTIVIDKDKMIEDELIKDDRAKDNCGANREPDDLDDCPDNNK